MAYIGNTADQQAFTPAIDYFNGNGSTTAFTLSRPVASVAQVQAVIENVPQNPGDAFTVSGNTITFTSAPPSGTSNIYVYYTSLITTVATLSQDPVITGSMTFGSTGARIRGDFSNATNNNRVLVQSSTTNGTTRFMVIPNGTNTVSDFRATNSSDTTNFSDIRVQASSTVCSIQSNRAGTGSFLPLTFQTNNSEALRIDTSGNVGIGTSSPTAQLQLNKSGTGDYTAMRWSNSGASGRTYEIGLGGNTAAAGYANSLYFYDSTAGAIRSAIDSSGNFLFNSGYGSAATAYGTRVWVNFNGTGTPAIRASGGASSITDHGTGQYTVNFSITFPDTDYVATGTTNDDGSTGNYNVLVSAAGTPATTSFRIITAKTSSNSIYDPLYVYMTFVR